MNRGSDILREIDENRVVSFNEAPIHESGKLIRQRPSPRKRARLQ